MRDQQMLGWRREAVRLQVRRLCEQADELLTRYDDLKQDDACRTALLAITEMRARLRSAADGSNSDPAGLDGVHDDD